MKRDWRAYAHRGGAREAAENSLTAFRRAVDLGYSYLETDVRPSRDGVAVVHHDARLDRTTDAVGAVRERTWQELRQVRLADGTTPLRLEELLEEFPGAHITVDAKEQGSVTAIVDAIRRCRAVERVCVASFSPRRLAALRRMLPEAESGAHPWEVLQVRAIGRPVTAARQSLRASRVQVPLRAMGLPFAEPGFIARAHRLGLAVDVWTVDDPAEMARLIDLGVDGIMTDSPTVLRSVLAAAGRPLAA